MSRDELLQLIPAYVLGALEEDERSQVELLLVDDAEAQTIEKEYREIEMMLPFTAVNREASPDLKDRLLQRIREDDAADETDAIATVDETDDNDDTAPENVVPYSGPYKEKPKRRPRRQVVLPLVAAIVIVLVGLVFVLTSTQQTETPQAVFRSLYEERDAAHVYVTPSADSAVSASLLISSDGERAALRVQQLPELGSDQTFQLWLIDDAGSQNGGIYQADKKSELYLVIPNEKPIYTYNRFGMSIEPAGGSPLGDSPTGDRVFAVDVPEYTEQDQ